MEERFFREREEEGLSWHIKEGSKSEEKHGCADVGRDKVLVYFSARVNHLGLGLK